MEMAVHYHNNLSGACSLIIPYDIINTNFTCMKLRIMLAATAFAWKPQPQFSMVQYKKTQDIEPMEIA